MSELNRIVEWRTPRYATKWKIVDWTLGMAFAAFVIFDGKATSEHLLQHLLIGAALGFVLASSFHVTRRRKARRNSSIVAKSNFKPSGMK